MPFEVVLDGNIWQVDLVPGATDSIGTPLFILPRLRDPKTDFAVTLGFVLGALGLPNNLDSNNTGMSPTRALTIVKNGTFHQSMLRDIEYNERPVINIALNGQNTERVGIGLNSGGMVGGGALIDPQPYPNPDNPGAIAPVVGNFASSSTKKKTTTIELDIFALNIGLADAYKDVIIAACDHIVENVMIAQLGYVEVLETAASESTNPEPALGDPMFLYQRSLDYRCTWFSMAVQQPGVFNVIRQVLTIIDPNLDPSSPPEQVGTNV